MSILRKVLLIAFFLTGTKVCFAETIIGKVVAITDGDTIKIVNNQTLYKIRLSGIDAPEKKQSFGQKSKQNLSNLIFDKEVTVESHKTDRYGRLIAVVTLNNISCQIKPCLKSIDVGLFQIESGLAWHYKKYASEQTLADQKIYAEAEKQAAFKRIGIWSDQQPIPPWDFRKKGGSNGLLSWRIS